MYRRELEKLKDKEGNVPHTVKSKNEFQGPSTNKTRVRTFRDNPKAIKHALRIKMLKTFICPPLVVSSEGDLFSVRSLLDVAAKDKYTLELTEMGEIRIYPSDSFAYFDIANMLLENDLPLRGLKQGGKSDFKAICIGFHKDESVIAIQEALGALGHDVLQISKPMDFYQSPLKLPIYTITLERAENNWEIFNITKLLGMKVTIRPPPRVVPLPTCSNCFQVGHFEYECGRRLCHSCGCSYIKGQNVIAKFAYEWPLTVKTRVKGPEKTKKQIKKRIKRASDVSSEQQCAINESPDSANERQEGNDEPCQVVHESQEANDEKVENICKIEGISELQDISYEWPEESSEPQQASGRRLSVKALKKIEKQSFRSSYSDRGTSTFDNDDDDETDEEEFNLMGYISSDSSLLSTSSTTATFTSTTGDSAVFDDSSIPSETEHNPGEPNGLKKMLKEWLLDVTVVEENSSSASSPEAFNPLKMCRKKFKKFRDLRSKKSFSHNQEMITCHFTHTHDSKSHEQTKESADPLGRRPIIKRKKNCSNSRTRGYGTNTRVSIVKERIQGRNGDPLDSGEEGGKEEEYEENEVHTLMMSAEYAFDTEPDRSQQESPVRNHERNRERSNERDDERRDENFVNEDRRVILYRDIQREAGRPLSEEYERFFSEELERQANGNLQREVERHPSVGRERYLFEEQERRPNEDRRNVQREPGRRIFEGNERHHYEANRNLQRESERQRERPVNREPQELAGRGQESDDSATFRPLRRRRLLPPDPRTMAQKYAAVAPPSFASSQRFSPTLYNRRYPYRYEEFVNTYMGNNNNEEIPDEAATAWLDMVYHDIESLLNYVDRIGRVESYRLLLNKVEERFFQKFGERLSRDN